MPHRLVKTIDGRRGGALSIISVVFLAYGWGFLVRPAPAASLVWIPGDNPNGPVGWVLLSLGTLSLILAVFSKTSKYALASGYMVAFVAGAGMGVLFGISWSLGILPDPSASIVFLGFAALILYLSGWDEERPAPLTGGQRAVIEAVLPPPADEEDR